ncbi:MAG: tetratricopeptide repeat protein [Acidobacteriota bacterium]
MYMKYIVLCLLVFHLIFTGCSNSVRNKIITEQEIKKENRFRDLEREGNTEFEKMHWTGWSNAINIYEKTLKIKDSGPVRENIFFSLLHRSIRSRFFFLSGEPDLKRAKDLLAGMQGRSESLNLFYKIARMYIFPDEPYLVSKKDLEILRSDIKEDYKYFFYVLHQRRKLGLQPYRKELTKMIKLFPDSNLKYFLRDKFIEIDKGIRANPDFIELLITKGDRFFSTGNFKKAEEYYLKTLEYDDKTSVALTGLGNIYNHFELYHQALDYYLRSSEITPLYYKALFGQAVCLSQLGEYQKSIGILNLMLENDLWYKGEVYYYRAFNNFVLNEYSKVEPDLKNSEKFIPDSVELHTLSGMFYYETKKYEDARLSFKRSISINKRYPRPYYYLGYLDIQKKDIKNSLLNFSLAGIYYLEMIDNSIQNISNLNKLSISKKRIREIQSRRFKRVISKIDEIIIKMKNVLVVFKNLKKEKLKFLYKIIENLKLKKQQI